MKQRSFGNTTINVSEIGLGTWQIGGSWGEVSEAESMKILHTAVEQGVNFFDTADVYGDGRSESLIGRFLKESTAVVFVATKLGRSGDPGWPENFSLEAMRAHTEASLRRLDTESLGLTQLHCIPTEVLRDGEVFEHLRTLQQEGKIQRFGASVESMEEASLCLEQEGLTSLQIIFNIFRQKPAEELLQAAQDRGSRSLSACRWRVGCCPGSSPRNPGSRRTITGTSIGMGRRSTWERRSRGCRLRRAWNWRTG